MLSKGLRCKGRTGPFAITSNQLSGDHLCLQLFIYPFSFFTFEPMGRSATWRSGRDRVVEQVPERRARSSFTPESTRFASQHFSAGFHVNLRQTRPDMLFAKA